MVASALSPDGQRIAVGHSRAGRFARFRHNHRPLDRGHMSAHASPISAMAFSGDGAKLATADAEGTIKIWAGRSEAESKSAALRDAQGPSRGDHSRPFFDRWQAARHDQRRQNSQSLGPGKCRRGNSAIGRYISRLVASWHAFRPMGTGSQPPNGNSVRLWDAATGRLVRELPAGDNSSIFSVAFSPTDNRLLAVGYGGQADVSYVALWDIDAGTELVRLPGATDLPDFRAGQRQSARSVRWRFRPMGNIWPPVSAQRGGSIQEVLPIR